MIGKAAYGSEGVQQLSLRLRYLTYCLVMALINSFLQPSIRSGLLLVKIFKPLHMLTQPQQFDISCTQQIGAVLVW